MQSRRTRVLALAAFALHTVWNPTTPAPALPPAVAMGAPAIEPATAPDREALDFVRALRRHAHTVVGRRTEPNRGSRIQVRRPM